jgi:hypothetical protein
VTTAPQVLPFRELIMNLTGIVLPNLKALTGSKKLPPFEVSTEPPMGDRNPLKQ